MRWEVCVSHRIRIALALAGLIVIILSLVALAYAFWPIEPTSEQFLPDPTLLVPPQSALVWPRFT